MDPFIMSCRDVVPTNRYLGFHGIGYRNERIGRSPIITAINVKKRFSSFIYTYNPLTITINERIEQIPAHSLFLWDASKTVYYGINERSWRISWLQVWGRQFSESVTQLGVPLNSLIQLKSSDPFEHYLLAIYREMNAFKPPSIDLLSNHLQGLLLECRRHSRKRKSSPIVIPQNLQKAKALIHENTAQELTLDYLAQTASLSKTYFIRLFKRYYGLSPINYAINVRMDKAASLLESTALPVGKIAEIVGYDDPYHFSKIFKKKQGKSPLQHRKRALALLHR